MRPVCFHCTFSGLVSTSEVVLQLNFSCSLCVVFRGGSPHAEILCMQLTGKLATRSQDFSFSCLPQPHALSLSSDANEKISVSCALTQGDQTHWSAFSRRQSLSLMFLLCKMSFFFSLFFFLMRCPCSFSSRNFRKCDALCLCILLRCFPNSRPCALVPWLLPDCQLPAVTRSRMFTRVISGLPMGVKASGSEKEKISLLNWKKTQIQLFEMSLTILIFQEAFYNSKKTPL